MDFRRTDIETLAGDVVGLMDSLELEQAVVVGHDWGANLAWKTALLHPNRVSAVAGLSVPYLPTGGDRPPTEVMREVLEHLDFEEAAMAGRGRGG